VTVAEILDESRDFHASFTKQNVPDVPCMRALSRYVRRLAEKVTQADEAALAVQETVSSADLLVDHASRNDAIRFPCASVLGQRLYPLNLYDIGGTSFGMHGWEDFDGMELLLVPLYDDLTLPTSVIGLPDACRDALVCNLALFMAGRTARTASDLPLLPAQAMDAEAMAIATLAGQSANSTWRIA
jgi:hypothetical protein